MMQLFKLNLFESYEFVVPNKLQINFCTFIRKIIGVKMYQKHTIRENIKKLFGVKYEASEYQWKCEIEVREDQQSI